jgi:hexosaminidase
LADAIMRAAFVRDPTSDFGLVPVPRSIELGDGLTNFSEVRICAQDLPLVPIAEVLAEELRVLGAPQVRVVARGANVNLRLEPSLDTRGEFHRLTIRDGSIDIVASDPRGVSCGTATLMQAAEVRDDALVLPKLAIYDGPDTEFRALMVDVARKPHPLVVLKQCVELCRYYKLAFLQLHLTDDQAFTFPSKAYERLVTPGQHYTQDELRTLVAFAAARGVTIIPEIEMPGHGSQMVARMPETFRISDQQSSTIDFANPDAVHALEILLGEVADVFRDSPYIHIGGDETDFSGTKDNAHFQAAFQREHVDDADELYRKFIGHMNEVVKGLGKRTLVWEGFRPGGKIPIPHDMIVVGYESAYYTPDALVRDGFTVVNASWKPLYVVNDRNWTPREIYAWNRLLWQHFIDGFPAFDGIQLPPTDKVFGAMMCAWEQPAALEIPSLKTRVPAMSERLWQPRLRPGYDDFERRRAVADLKLVKLLAAIH